MILFVLALILGLVLLVWSAERFIEGAASGANRLGLPHLLIGMVIVGFGTSVPEMTVSGIASWKGQSGIATGNAYGSNIINIGLILGFTSLLKPIPVRSTILLKELPVLAFVSFLAMYQAWDGVISHADAIGLLGFFLLLLLWSLRESVMQKKDVLNAEFEEDLVFPNLTLKQSVFWMILGLVILIISSRLLVWGAVGMAQTLGVSDLIIGLTIVAVGTSLPELASSIAAARKGHNDIVLGNVLGSNLFNTLAVVGLAGVIQPMQVQRELLDRDLWVMLSFTLVLFVMGFRWKGNGRINRVEGGLLLMAFLTYTAWLVFSAF